MSGDIDTFSLDFGTTNSIACIFRNGNILPVPNPNRQGNNQFPSFVEYDNFNINTGYPAKSNFGRANHFVVAAVKRILGLTYNEYLKIGNKSIFGCEVVCGDDGMPRFVVSADRSKLVSPVEVATELFRTIKKEVDNFSNKNLSKAYVTIPADFDDKQIDAIKDAAELAGITIVKFIDEPTAAVMSWCLDNNDQLSPGENLLVYDFGGGTFDASHVRYVGDNTFEIMDTDGDGQLGGNDIDTKLMEHLLEKSALVSGSGTTVSLANLSHHKLMRYRGDCEQVKILLTSNMNYYDDEQEFREKNKNIIEIMDLSDYHDDLEDGLHVNLDDMIEICKPVVERSVEVTTRLLLKSNRYPGNVRFFFLVGGSSNLHYIKQSLKRHFKNAQFPIVNPDEAVAVGAMKLVVNDHLDSDEVTTNSYGLLSGTDDVVLLVKKDQPLPLTSEEFEFTNEKEYQQIYDCTVYQWSGNPDSLPSNIVSKRDCRILSQYQFMRPMRVAGRQSLLLQFVLNSSQSLDIICKDKNTGELVNHTVIRGSFAH